MRQSGNLRNARWLEWGVRARKLVVGGLFLTFVGLGSTAWGLQYDFPLDFTDDANDGAGGLSFSNVALGSLSVAGAVSTATGYQSQATGDNSVAYGAYSVASGIFSTAIGLLSTASGENSTAVGRSSTASGEDSMALGYLSSAAGTNSVALGQSSVATAANTVSVGSSHVKRRIVNVASGIASTDAATVGQMNAADTALGTKINAEATTRASADNALQTNIQTEATTRAAADSALQAGINANSADITALQNAGQGLAWTAGSNDVAASASGSGSTALGTGASARTRDTAIGSNATVTADGSVALGADTTVASENSVAVGADSSVATGAAGGVALGQNASVSTGATGSVALGQNSVATEANTVSVGSSGNERRVTNVAAAVNDTDAVNLEQLRQVEANLQADVGGIYNRLGKLESRLDDVGALASAFSALVPNARAGGNTQISIGYGNYGSANAVAAGMFHYVNNNVLFNAGVSTAFDNHETAARAGVTFGW